ncbi:hypothetical protein P154DRAFT_615093 [Amniculicola lignicola CBS 123094]|uniref:DUF7704 domain-containing protein n=1 Tax=Amniculicola lignicola CBS 123094 TaxID=1392246 RepID=A0A6A5X0R9_9PLEO|nr:hypothetical protein P154DRAFT_615093 [Amniculicola lignicola CBS 123094]
MALGTVLPFWPALLFTYLEPTFLLLGWQAAYQTPSTFVQSQDPNASALAPVHPGALILSYTLANIFVLLAAVAIICTAVTREARVAKAYLLVIAIADLGHIYASYKVVDPDLFWDLGRWNDVMMGNVGGSAFLHVNRVATLLGVFGRVGGRQ